MNAANELKDWLASSGISNGYRVQFGQWKDGLATDRFIVIQPFGGRGGMIERRPVLRVIVLGATNENPAFTQATAEAIVSQLRFYDGAMVDLQASEPRYYATEENRPFFELTVESITE